MGIRPQGGGGSRKGKPNKIGRIVKENVIEVFNLLGGVESMVKWARSNKTEFYKLYARLIPTEVTGTINVRDVSEYSDGELLIIATGGSARIAGEAAGEDEPAQVH